MFNAKGVRGADENSEDPDQSVHSDDLIGLLCSSAYFKHPLILKVGGGAQIGLCEMRSLIWAIVETRPFFLSSALGI